MMMDNMSIEGLRDAICPEHDDHAMSQDECMKLAKSLICSREKRGLKTSGDEISAVIDWANEARNSVMMLRGVLDGSIGIDIIDETICFNSSKTS
jgi:hypothetical protein